MRYSSHPLPSIREFMEWLTNPIFRNMVNRLSKTALPLREQLDWLTEEETMEQVPTIRRTFRVIQNISNTINSRLTNTKEITLMAFLLNRCNPLLKGNRMAKTPEVLTTTNITLTFERKNYANYDV
jgi:hypothetical protein